jgi:hypothetical protein
MILLMPEIFMRPGLFYLNHTFLKTCVHEIRKEEEKFEDTKVVSYTMNKYASHSLSSMIIVFKHICLIT